MSVRPRRHSWNIEAIYRALAAERVEGLHRRSADWVKPRLGLVATIQKANAAECERIERELVAAPAYLSGEDQERVERLLEAVHQRLSVLTEAERARRVADWLARFPTPEAVDALDRHGTEALLKQLQSPPDDLSAAERARLDPVATALAAHYDQMSMDDILARIRRLSLERQQRLYALLAAELG
ncbi:hypothetical protein F2Q65_18185 [Thiohalocapsa marina]|uniref:Uncharacterized protein n=1 Tax=Thiohalocapsa marina TaxID=424902 RepID=A0A5M8FEB6_9GAMM|nr:hypothetical protein [Thiohalocapsa marina]KAA6182250.1 hypothetical protein F2Q65_18185 [Thiohalocapsa marina]